MAFIDFYLPIRHLHVSAVGASVTLFAARGIGVLTGRRWPMIRTVRWGSVAIDTVLLGAGVALWAMLGLNPIRNTWLGTKLVLLVFYIGLGSFALKRAHTRTAKAAFWVVSLLCAAAMIAVAIAHDPAVLWRWL